jgi:sugar/nucleoside kinase (ribokinase family)
MRVPANSPFRRLLGIGGIGSGIFLALEHDRSIGRNESRGARLLDVRDYCKLHTVTHHVATLLGARPSGIPFHVVPAGAVGEDEAGHRLVKEMAAAGMDVRHVRTLARPTLLSVCFQYPDGDGGNITATNSAAAALSDRDLGELVDLIGPDTIVLAQPEVPLERRRRLLELGAERGAFRAASFTSFELNDARSRKLLELADIVAMNEHEASMLAQTKLDRSNPATFLKRCRSAFSSPVKIIVSSGRYGAYAIDGQSWGHRPAPDVEVTSTAGAGDALFAGILAGLAAGVPLLGDPDPCTLDDALGLGVLLASLNVTSPHTIHPAADARAISALADRAGYVCSGALAVVLQGRMEDGL